MSNVGPRSVKRPSPSTGALELDDKSLVRVRSMGRSQLALGTPVSLGTAGTGMTGMTARKAEWLPSRSSNERISITPMSATPTTLKTLLIGAIASASQGTPPTAIAKIGEWWSVLDDAAGLAEARTRILLKKVKAPPLSPEPAWVAEQVPELSQSEDDSAASHPLAIDSARKLIRACLTQLDDGVTYSADLRRGPLGRVAVSWKFSGARLYWMVTAADLPWPGVLVHSVARNDIGTTPKSSARIHHFIAPIIEEFLALARPSA